MIGHTNKQRLLLYIIHNTYYIIKVISILSSSQYIIYLYLSARYLLSIINPYQIIFNKYLLNIVWNSIGSGILRMVYSKTKFNKVLPVRNEIFSVIIWLLIQIHVRKVDLYLKYKVQKLSLIHI